jgi:predicted DsbA family dithiol-disulfide isomerase
MPNGQIFLLIATLALSVSCQGQETESTPGGGPITNTVDASAATSAVQDEGSGVVARVGAGAITAAELDAWIKNDLFESAWDNETELYELRTESVERMATEQLLERAANAKGLTVEEYVSQAVDSQGEITDEQVAAFYEEQNDKMGGMTLEQVAPRIRNFLGTMRASDVVLKAREGTEITVLLERPRIEMAGDGPSKGPADAKVTIIEFSDFQCPYCSRALPVLDELMKRYPNDLRIVYRHLPLDQIHPRARPAAEASACADDQGKFWPYHDLLFSNSKALEDEDLKRYATDVGLDAAVWEECMAAAKFRAKIQDDLQAGRDAGLSSTPAFLINGILVTGAKPIESFVSIIDAELGRDGES